MGFASYVEDIREKAAELRRFNNSLAVCIRSKSRRSRIDVAAVRKLISQAGDHLASLEKDLELASDPSVEIAHRLNAAERERDQLQNAVQRLQNRLDGLEKAIEDMRRQRNHFSRS